MEKSTISALIAAGGAMLGGIVQVFILRAAKRHKAREYEAATKEREERLPAELKDP